MLPDAQVDARDLDASPTRAAQASGGTRRYRILDAAIAEFAEHGFGGATWRGVAGRAGVAQGLIKFYFDDKDGLWRAALEHVLVRQAEDTPDVPTAALTLAKAETWLRDYVRHAARHADGLRMTLHESAPGNPRIAWAAGTLLRQAHERFAMAVEALQARGHLAGHDPLTLRYALVGAVYQPFVAREEVAAIHDVDTGSEAFVERHADAMVRLFLGASVLDAPYEEEEGR